MSHWSGENVSPSVAGSFGRPPGGGPLVPSSFAAGSASLDANLAVEETPSTRLSWPIRDAKAGSSERAMATPISL
jgi:hypothetical protein